MTDQRSPRTLDELQAEHPLIDWTAPMRIRRDGAWRFVCRVCLANVGDIEELGELALSEDAVAEHIRQVHAS